MFFLIINSSNNNNNNNSNSNSNSNNNNSNNINSNNNINRKTSKITKKLETCMLPQGDLFQRKKGHKI